MFSAFQVCATHSNSLYCIDSHRSSAYLSTRIPVWGVPRIPIRSIPLMPLLLKAFSFLSSVRPSSRQSQPGVKLGDYLSDRNSQAWNWMFVCKWLSLELGSVGAYRVCIATASGCPLGKGLCMRLVPTTIMSPIILNLPTSSRVECACLRSSENLFLVWATSSVEEEGRLFSYTV